MSKNDLLKKIARLESINDQLLTELTTIDQLMHQVGFEGGIETIKATALELMRIEEES